MPTDVYKSRCYDDHADSANDHQHHKQFAIVAACLTELRLASASSTVVLDAHLIKETHAISTLHRQKQMPLEYTHFHIQYEPANHSLEQFMCVYVCLNISLKDIIG